MTRARHPSPAPSQPPHVMSAARAVTAKFVQPMGEIGIVAAQSALHDHRGDVGCLSRVAQLRRRDHHARKSGRQRQRPQPPADRRDTAVRVERLQLCQLLAGGANGRGRGRIDPGQRARIGCSPFRAVQQQTCKISGTNLRLGERSKALRLPLVPQAIADAGLGTAGAAPAADRRPRETRARSRAGSRRHRARSAERAQGRCR